MLKKSNIVNTAKGFRGIRFLIIAWILLVAATNAEADTDWRQEVMTAEEAASMLRLSRDQLERFAMEKNIPGRRIGRHWRFSRSALLAWLSGEVTTPKLIDRDEAVRNHANENSPHSLEYLLTPSELLSIRGRGSDKASSDGGAQILGEKPGLDTAEDIFLRDQGVLLKGGQATLEMGLFYSKSDQQDLTTFVTGSSASPIPVRVNVEQSTFTSSFTGRYGLRDNLQLFASIPLVHQKNKATILADQTLSDETRTEWGDFNYGLRYAALKEGLGYPSVILSLEGLAPTADRSYAVGGGIALTKSIDPAVLFGNLNYRYTFSKVSEDVTRLRPENAINTTLGIAYALNDTLTLSTSLSGEFTTRTEFKDTVLPSREQFSLLFGVTALITEGLYIEPSVSFNLNGNGSDFTFGLSIPYTLNF